ncbi:4-hydroxy-tetrahydrodipicolinate synthase [Candidatus Haliotispira prima]|uniref:4-hydroxy-tetrahydrodipicolinate synthase n=1 Tax=Candidatus Haliotispira prima TaxID=3034016 RepID=A0ABY8MF91_9SPIO|nr:4-hydroxy-tetrahydrodipicolinate synthase [Candidatus Haliotispira prima]
MSVFFSGLYTALITPFTDDNKIDYKALERLLTEQIEAGVDGLVVMGTTGESPVIYGREMEDLTRFVREQTRGRNCKIIIGTGSNDTAFAEEETRMCDRLDVDAMMIVNPYYNKPTQEGLFQHFRCLAAATERPILLYNIKGRTGVNLETPTLLRLIEAAPNIRGVKEASGDLDQISDVIRKTPSDFAVLSGDDALTFHLMLLGGSGTVSVMSNLRPQVMRKLINALAEQNIEKARALQFQWLDLMRALLSVGNNPLAVKTLLHLEGRAGRHVRSPLWPLDKEEQDLLHGILQRCEAGGPGS